MQKSFIKLFIITEHTSEGKVTEMSIKKCSLNNYLYAEFVRGLILSSGTISALIFCHRFLMKIENFSLLSIFTHSNFKGTLIQI